jgi:hypothetical protein
MTLRLVVLIMAFATSNWITVAGAVELEKLVMPGEVIDGHADIESDCSDCHVAFSRNQQNPLCEACHEDVAADIQKSLGYHGRAEDARTQECASCHTEHRGRDANIVVLNPKLFDHRLTDFVLEGGHTEVACEDCHDVGTKHRQATSLCFDCHAEDDVHSGGLGEDCESCHVVTSWVEAEFDHGEETGYALLSGHLEVQCTACHVDHIYVDTPTDCYSCHRDDDTHDGLNGSDCAFCHVASSWTEAQFDHGAETTFALLGKHGEIGCSDCHAENKFEQKLDTECIACHREDDEHDGFNGEDCGACHSSSSWSESLFKHEMETDFALLGGHADLVCGDCHVQPVHEVLLETDCYGCHQDDDSHENQLGKACGQCHNESGWTVNVLFDHGLTAFPLIGSHRDSDCADCHETARFNDAPEACIDCHRDEDVHERKLGTDCGTCHSPTDWAFWDFDHNRRTTFELDGAHLDLRCEACHTRPMSGAIEMSDSCGGCHRGDDVHDGDFGNDCERCHTTRDFQSAERVRR